MELSLNESVFLHLYTERSGIKFQTKREGRGGSLLTMGKHQIRGKGRYWTPLQVKKVNGRGTRERAVTVKPPGLEMEKFLLPLQLVGTRGRQLGKKGKETGRERGFRGGRIWGKRCFVFFKCRTF